MSLLEPLRVFQKKDRWCFQVRIQAGASRDKMAGSLGEVFKVQISAPPLEGRANRRLIDFLAKSMGLSRSRLEILAGLRSRDKTIAVSEVSKADLVQILKGFQSRSNRSK